MKNFFKKLSMRSAVTLFAILSIFTFTAFQVSALIASVTVLSPNGGERLGGANIITWTTSPLNDPGTVDIYLESAVGTVAIALAEANDGSYTWDSHSTMAGILADRSDYRIYITSSANPVLSDYSDAVFTVDNTAPVITAVSIPDVAMKIGSTATATITVNDDASDLYTLTTGTIDGFILGSLLRTNSTTYTATFTVTNSGADVAAGASIPVANLVLADTATNPNSNTLTPFSSLITQASDAIDATLPTLTSVSIASNNASTTFAKTGDVVTLSFTSSETIGAPAVVIAGSSTGAVIANPSGNNWTATYTMQAGDTEGIVPFTIDFSDTATNAGVQVTAVTDTSSVTFDKTLPVVAFAQDVEAGPVSSDTISLTVTDTNGNTASYMYGTSTDTTCDVTDVYNTAFTSGSPFTITTEAENGTYICAKAIDKAGNIGYSVASANDLNLDISPPVIASVSLPTGTYKIGDTITVTIDADAAGYTKGTIIVNGVTLAGALTDVTDSTYTIVYTVTEGDLDVLAAGVPTVSVILKDSLLNANTAFTTATETGGDVVIDAHRPTVTATMSDAALKSGETSTLTFTFSEVPAGFTAADIDLTSANGTTGAVSATGDPLVFTAIFTPSAGIDDALNTISVNMADFTDVALNAGSGSTSTPNYTIDTLAPTLAITMVDTALLAGETSTTTFTFSEAVTGFTNADVTTIDNGTLSAVSSTDGGITWIALFTPTASVSDGTNVITVTMTGLTDVATNPGVGTQSTANYSVETVRPTVVVTMSDAALKVGETSTVTFTFSEAPTGFDASDVDLTNASGTTGAVSATGNPLVFTALFTPTASVEDSTNVITVGTDWANVATNAPSASTSTPNYTIDTLAPTLTSVVIASSNASTSLATTGDIVTLSFTSSETIGTPVVVISGGSATVANVGGNNWTATRVMLSTYTEGVVPFTVNFSDSATNAGIQVTSTTNASSVTFDKSSPVMISSLPANNAGGLAITDSAATVTFDQNIILVDATKVRLVNDSTSVSYKGVVSVDGGDGMSSVLNIPYTGLVNGTLYRINILPGAISDVAGNLITENRIHYFTTVSVVVAGDTTAPVASSIVVTPGQSTSTVEFASNEVGTTKVGYGLTSTHGNVTVYSAMATSSTNTIVLTGLTCSTTYHYSVYGKDSSNNESISTDSTFVTSPCTVGDSTAPVTSAILVTPATTTASVAFTSNEVGTAKVGYGLTSTHGNVTVYSAMAASSANAIVLTGLTCGTTYHYSVYGKDASNNESVSTDATFVTSACSVGDITTPTISSHAPVDGTTGVAITSGITVVFDEAMDAATLNGGTIQLRKYSDDSSIASVINYNPATYTVTLTPVASLTNSTQYYVYVVGAKDISGNTVSTDYSAATKASHEFTTVAMVNGSLAVTGINTITSTMTADNTYGNGGSWTFLITVPTSDTSLKLKFADWVSGANSIATANNMRVYSVQSSNAAASTTAITVTAAGTYTSALTLTGDLDTVTPGRQVQVTVDLKVPVSTAGGSYSTSYGVKSEGSI